jgi:hypothetical protein
VEETNSFVDSGGVKKPPAPKLGIPPEVSGLLSRLDDDGDGVPCEKLCGH